MRLTYGKRRKNLDVVGGKLRNMEGKRNSAFFK
jgi:hypothetical protein